MKRMNLMKNKIKAESDIAVGNIKEKVGNAIGSPGLREEGKADQVKGNVRKAVESVKDATKAAFKP